MSSSSSHGTSPGVVLAATVATVSLGCLAIKNYRNAGVARAEQDKTDTGRIFEIPSELLSGCYANEMKLAVRLAMKAGENMIPHLEHKGTKSGAAAESALGIATKTNDSDFCTQIDLMNEKLVIDGITSVFPEHSIIGEESTGTGKPAPLTDAPTWIIDPIDGTTNFASGCPLTCVSIGFCIGGEPVMGVVYSPITRELYLGMKGRGSYRNGEQITVSCANGKQLSNAVVCFEFGYARSEEGVERMVNAVKRILLHGCRTTRSYGSGVLDLCYIASGRIDVVYCGIDEEGWKPWDYCAAMVIVEEAGCTIRSLKGDNSEFDVDGKVIPSSKFNIYSNSMICGVNTTVVEQLRRVIIQ